MVRRNAIENWNLVINFADNNVSFIVARYMLMLLGDFLFPVRIKNVRRLEPTSSTR